MLRDLEEMLLSVPDRDSRDFMREAVRCYQAGTFRSAIVMAVAAAMDDLRRKLMEQASSGGAPEIVKTSASTINELFQAEQAFESTLIDVCQKDANVFVPAEAAKMRLLLKLRHLCAHPSGHIATAEEAREAITSAIDLVLSRPALLGMIAVTTLLGRLEGPLFFPSPTTTLTAVQDATRQLQPALYRALAKKVVERVLAEAREDARNPSRTLFAEHSAIRENGVRFLQGMIQMGGSTRDAVWYYIGVLLESSEADSDTLKLLNADANGIASMSALTRERSIALARRQLSTSDSRTLIRKWIDAGLLGAQEEIEIEALAVNVLLRRVDEHTYRAIRELGWSGLIASFLQLLVDNAGSKRFVESNSAIEAMQGISSDLASQVTAEQRIKYILGVASSSDGTSYYGREARRIVTDGLGPRADFLDSLREQAVTEPTKLRESNPSWVQLARLIRSSERPDVLRDVLACFQGHEAQDYYRILEMLEESVAVPEVAELANALLVAGKAAVKPKYEKQPT